MIRSLAQPEPATLTLNAEGVAYETGMSRQFLGWPAINRVRHSPQSWWFIGHGVVPIMVVTRTMTSGDEAALDAAVQRFRPDVHIRCVMSGPHHTARTGYQRH